MRKVYEIIVTGLMTEKDARTIANVGQAVNPTVEVTVTENSDKPGAQGVLKSKPFETQRW